MYEEIEGQDLHELARRYDIKAGVNEYASSEAAHSHFTQVMRQHGYTRGPGGTWLKPGCAAVLEPR